MMLAFEQNLNEFFTLCDFFEKQIQSKFALMNREYSDNETSIRSSHFKVLLLLDQNRNGWFISAFSEPV